MPPDACLSRLDFVGTLEFIVKVNHHLGIGKRHVVAVFITPVRKVVDKIMVNFIWIRLLDSCGFRPVVIGVIPVQIQVVVVFI